MRPLGVAVVAGILSVLGVTTLAAQSRWAEPYRRGREAIEKQNWKEAVPQLERAVAADPRPDANKLEEGTFRTPYFPYHYLGLAYLRLGNFKAAQENFVLARKYGGMPAALAKQMPGFEAEVLAGLKPVPPPPIAEVLTPPRPDPRIEQAETALANRRFAEALQLFDALRSALPGEFAKLGLAASRAAAATGRADELVQDGQAALKNGRLSEAESKFKEAEALVPGSGQPGLTGIRTRRSEYDERRVAGDKAAASGRLEEAIQNFQKARDLDPDRYSADNLDARIQTLQQQVSLALVQRRLIAEAQEFVKQRRYAEAALRYRDVIKADPKNEDADRWLQTNELYESQRDRGRSLHAAGRLDDALQPLLEARRLDGVRFGADRLDRLVDEITKNRAALPEADLTPIREALTAYLDGDAQRAVTLLEPVVSRPESLDSRLRRHAHAYLGAAYAAIALTSRDQDAAQASRQRAIEQFRLTIAIQPDYQLPQLVSPRIHDLLDEARKSR